MDQERVDTRATMAGHAIGDRSPNTPQPAGLPESEVLENQLRERLSQADDAIRYHEEMLFQSRSVANACQQALNVIEEHRMGRMAEAKVAEMPQSSLGRY